MPAGIRYREMYGYNHSEDPIGPEPACTTPDQRAAWHEASAALGSASGPDVRTMPDGRLVLLVRQRPYPQLRTCRVASWSGSVQRCPHGL